MSNNYAAKSTIELKFTTVDSLGVPTTLLGTPVVSIYKGSSLVETVTGVSLTVDFDGMTGVNHVTIVTTNVFYAVGKDYQAIITTGTVDGISVVGYVVREFSIENRFTGNVKFSIVTDPGNTTSTFKTNLTASVNNYYADPTLVLCATGVNAGQVMPLNTLAAGSYDGTDKFLTLKSGYAFANTPIATDTYMLVIN